MWRYISRCLSLQAIGREKPNRRRAIRRTRGIGKTRSARPAPKKNSMSLPSEIGLTLLMMVAAALYASVGHAGASGYLASMALFGVSPDVMKPTALTLNI